MRRRLPFVLGLLLIVACDPADPETQGPPPPPDAGCTHRFPKRLTFDDPRAVLVTACDSEDRLSAMITNHSPGVLRLTAVDASTIWRFVSRPNDFTDRMIESLVGSSASVGTHGFLLYPGHAVTVESPTEPHITIGTDVSLSAPVLASAYLSEWIEDKMSASLPRLPQAAFGCVHGIAEQLKPQPAQPWEDVVRSTLVTLPDCATTVADVRGSADDAVVRTSADEIVGQSRKFRGLWDDFVSLAIDAIRLRV